MKWESYSQLTYRYPSTKPAISPFKSINRPSKTDCYNGTTYNRLFI